MEDTSTVSKPRSARASSRRGAPSRLLRVESFVGIAANEAAQAVRRAGLKPGLERSFGCEPGLTGRIVAQEPEPGAELARNALVTLYVAAPAATAERAPTSVELQQQPTRAFAPVEPAPRSDAPARRRKPGRLSAAPAFDVPPAPLLPGELADARTFERDDDAVSGQDDLDDLGAAPDEYVIAADELFARGDWRATHRPALAPVSWLGARLRRSSKLLRVALALLVLWLLVALGAVLLAHGARRTPRPQSPPARVATPAIAEQPGQLPQHRPAAPKRARRPRRRARHVRAPHRVAHTAARRVPSTPTRGSSSPASRTPAPSSSTPAPRHEGGLFSP